MTRLEWPLAGEIRSLALGLLTWLPTRLGIRARRQLLRLFVGEVGKNVRVLPGLRITSPELVRIGSNCQFNYGVFITGGGGVTIGDWVGFGPDAKIWSVNHRFSDPDTPWQQQDWDRKPVKIEDDVWIAANVFVMPGVTIGRGAIVSASSVVNKSIPPFAIVSGNPARVIGWRRAPTSAATEAARGSGASNAEGVMPDTGRDHSPAFRREGTLHESAAESQQCEE